MSVMLSKFRTRFAFKTYKLGLKALPFSFTPTIQKCLKAIFDY